MQTAAGGEPPQAAERNVEEMQEVQQVEEDEEDDGVEVEEEEEPLCDVCGHRHVLGLRPSLATRLDHRRR